jgi:hypothetical protein
MSHMLYSAILGGGINVAAGDQPDQEEEGVS